MVIATSTKVELPNLAGVEINDEYFKNETSRKNTRNLSDEAIAMKKAEKKPMRPEQALVDDKIMAVVEKTPLMKEYLKSRFFLSHGNCPHKMAF